MTETRQSGLEKICDDLHRKLAAAGFVQARLNAGRETKLGAYRSSYISGRTDIKPNTRRNLVACKDRLVRFFGPARQLATVTAADADAWLVTLKSDYSPATIGRTVKRAKQFFLHTDRAEIITKNPFQHLKAPGQVNKARFFFVGLGVAHKVLEACPDAGWRLLFVLSRFGGLRCPSEHLSLRWDDMDWARGQFRVHAPKNEAHENGGDRWVPMFPEFWPYLEECFELAEEGAKYVISRYRGANVNLCTQFKRILARARVAPWPKLFHNLRATRQTELARTYPSHVVCAWLGSTELIAAKHYLEVTEDDFKRACEGGAESGAVFPKSAVQNPVQQEAALNCTMPQNMQKPWKNPGFVQDDAISCGPVQVGGIPPRGVVPMRFSRVF